MMVAQMRLDGMLYVHCLSCGALDMDELGHNRGYYGVRGGGGGGTAEKKTWYTQYAEGNCYVSAETWWYTLNLLVQKRCMLVKVLQLFQSRRNLFLGNWSHDETILHTHQLLWIHQKLNKKIFTIDTKANAWNHVITLASSYKEKQ